MPSGRHETAHPGRNHFYHLAGCKYGDGALGGGQHRDATSGLQMRPETQVTGALMTVESLALGRRERIELSRVVCGVRSPRMSTGPAILRL